MLVDIIASLQGSDGEVTPFSEVCELLTKIHDILGNALSKGGCNTACILTYFKILLLGSIMKSGIHTSPFFTIFRTPFW